MNSVPGLCACYWSCVGTVTNSAWLLCFLVAIRNSLKTVWNMRKTNNELIGLAFLAWHPYYEQGTGPRATWYFNWCHDSGGIPSVLSLKKNRSFWSLTKPRAFSPHGAVFSKVSVCGAKPNRRVYLKTRQKIILSTDWRDRSDAGVKGAPVTVTRAKGAARRPVCRSTTGLFEEIWRYY